MKQKKSEKIYSKLQLKRVLLCLRKELERRVEWFETNLESGERIRIRSIAQYRMHGAIDTVLREIDES